MLKNIHFATVQETSMKRDGNFTTNLFIYMSLKFLMLTTLYNVLIVVSYWSDIQLNSYHMELVSTGGMALCHG